MIEKADKTQVWAVMAPKNDMLLLGSRYGMAIFGSREEAEEFRALCARSRQTCGNVVEILLTIEMA